MSGPMTVALGLAIFTNVGLLLLILLPPPPEKSSASKALIFVAMFLLPLLVLAGGLAYHLEASKSTSFCLSCHVMTPYNRSLYIDSDEHLPAAHFQNRRIDREQACYTCHTTYAMFGDTRAKLTGLKHVWVNYVGTIPEKLELYQAFNNRECLHCHSGVRSYSENELHSDILKDLESNEVACLDCHEMAHDIENLRSHGRWEE